MYSSLFEDQNVTKVEHTVSTFEGSPEKERCDHPSNGEVVVAKDIDAKPGKAGMDETKIKTLILLKRSRIELWIKQQQRITSAKQFLGVFQSKSRSALSHD